MHFYKWIRDDHKHFTHFYKKGLNVDQIPFNPTGSDQPGGLYYTREDILAFIGYGYFVYQVDIPEYIPSYKDPDTYINYWKSPAIIISNPRPLNLETVIDLVLEGANPHVNDEKPLILAANYGMLDLVEYFVTYGANIDAQNGSALRYATINNRMPVINYLQSKGAKLIEDKSIEFDINDMCNPFYSESNEYDNKINELELQIQKLERQKKLKEQKSLFTSEILKLERKFDNDFM